MTHAENLLKLSRTQEKIHCRAYIEEGYIFRSWHPFNNCPNRLKGNREVAISQPNRETAKSLALQNPPVCDSCGATYLLSADVRSWGRMEEFTLRNS